jgi:putative tricarboxylic transport membrane protein
MFDLTLKLRMGAACAAVALLVTAGCGATADRAEPGSSAGGAGQPLTGLRFMVPNTAGGGYDTTARAAAKVMDEIGVTRNVEVFNLAGAGGTVGLSRTASEKGNGDLMMMMGLGVVGAQYTNKSQAKLDQTTPIAKLIEESGAIVVPKSSPYKTIGDVNFVSYDGGGDLLPALLGGKVAFGASGFSEFLDQVEAGEVRVLAISGAQRVDAIEAPTLKESGIDLEFTNWRGVVAPPEISETDKAAMVAALDTMHASQEWKDVLTKNGWTDAYLPADQFAPFLTEQTTNVESTLQKLGLA